MVLESMLIATSLWLGAADSSYVAEADTEAAGGVISGSVLNLSRDGRPAADVEVLLLAELDGEFTPVGKTQTDDQGRFAFRKVPLDLDVTFRPGANLGGIHYPGPKLQLNRRRTSADIELAVRETLVEPSPLQIRQHEVVVQAEPGALHVTEALLVDNPTSKTYVGRSQVESMPPVTFQLGVPNDFERLTFEREMFGRSFTLVNGRLLTSMPWEPGQRWLRFTYTLRNEQTNRQWQRKIDAPCEHLLIRIRDGETGDVRCNLAVAEADEPGERRFEHAGNMLPAGHTVTVEFGALPIPWMAYGRWTALALLIAAISGTVLYSRWVKPTPGETPPESQVTKAPHMKSRSGPGKKKRRNKIEPRR